MLAATKVKMSGSERKREQEHIHIQRVTGKCLKVSRSSRAKQRQRLMFEKSVLHMHVICMFAAFLPSNLREISRF